MAAPDGHITAHPSLSGLGRFQHSLAPFSGAFSVMSRAHRSHSPGVPFHLTARLQGMQPLFTGLEGAVAQLIQQCAERADGELLAYAVMPNHIHIVYVQGTAGLAVYMQPLLTRVAWLMRQRRGVQGHVFERRYRDNACISADHLRNAIAYVHLNPVRAGLCRGVGDYPWTTHFAVCAAAPRRSCVRANAVTVRCPSPCSCACPALPSASTFAATSPELRPR